MTEERKKAICRRFSKAAATYDEYALVQKESAARLATCLPEQFSAARILEIGCGTGNFTAQLAARFPQASLTALDFSEAMVEQAAKKCREYGVSFLSEDGEQYLAENKQQFDLIASNATMQWFDDLPTAFSHVARSLAPGGIFLASLFGPSSLHELAAALAGVFAESPRLPAAQFPDREKILELAQARFHRVEIDETVYRRMYLSLQDLFRHISKTGTGGYHPSMPRLTRGRLKRLEEWFRNHGDFELSYQVFFLTAASPGEDKK
ncbi:MAG: malonyl-ACP O-methyltransferase BioC [Proteobacteria bacterium]|nr:malonyl-ACP O-methyltransferase BioC [Pseudomonadota bacterium]MBU4297353.1 malonyl-ACP O-methyltransferase BioC [Pseudomonadota bacterium]MCG2748948.1 malonyl-ACP O-methyltransferase BioC [Desulfobulbaceae bacterium]